LNDKINVSKRRIDVIKNNTDLLFLMEILYLAKNIKVVIQIDNIDRVKDKQSVIIKDEVIDDQVEYIYEEEISVITVKKIIVLCQYILVDFIIKGKMINAEITSNIYLSLCFLIYRSPLHVILLPLMPVLSLLHRPQAKGGPL